MMRLKGPSSKMKDQVALRLLKEQRSQKIFKGTRSFWAQFLVSETVLNLGFQVSPCGSTPHAVQHRTAAAIRSWKPASFDYSSNHENSHAVPFHATVASASSGTLLMKGFPVSMGGSTPCGSCNDNSICGNVDEASLLGVPEFVLNCELDGSEGVATKPLSKMMVRHGVKADKASDLVENRVSLGIGFGDHSLCHRAPLPTSVTASLPSAVVGCGPGPSSRRGRRARWSGRGSALCCSCCGLDLVGGNGDTCGECLLLAHGSDPWNSCVGHGEGQGAEHLHEVAGETKPKCTSTGFGVWQPLEGSLPVADELVKDPRRV